MAILDESFELKNDAGYYEMLVGEYQMESTLETETNEADLLENIDVLFTKDDISDESIRLMMEMGQLNDSSIADSIDIQLPEVHESPEPPKKRKSTFNFEDCDYDSDIWEALTEDLSDSNSREPLKFSPSWDYSLCSEDNEFIDHLLGEGSCSEWADDAVAFSPGRTTTNSNNVNTAEEQNNRPFFTLLKDNNEEQNNRPFFNDYKPERKNVELNNNEEQNNRPVTKRKKRRKRFTTSKRKKKTTVTKKTTKPSINKNNNTESKQLIPRNEVTTDTVEPVTKTVDEICVSKPVQSEIDCANSYNNIKCATQEPSDFYSSISENNATESIHLTYPTTSNSEDIRMDTVEKITEIVNELYLSKSVQNEIDCVNSYNNMKCATQEPSDFCSSISENNATESIHLTYPTTSNSEDIRMDTVEKITEIVNELYLSKSVQNEIDCVNSYNNMKCATQEPSDFCSSISENNATESIHLTYPTTSNSEDIRMDTVEKITEIVDELYLSKSVQNEIDCVNSYNNMKCATQEPSDFCSSISENNATESIHLTYPTTSNSEDIRMDTVEKITEIVDELYLSKSVQNEIDCVNSYNNMKCATQEPSDFCSSINENNATESIHLTYPTTSNSKDIRMDTVEQITEIVDELYLSKSVQNEIDCVNSYNNMKCATQEPSDFCSSISENNATESIHLTYPTTSNSEDIRMDTVEKITEIVDELYLSKSVQNEIDCVNSYNNMKCATQEPSDFSSSISENNATESIHLTYPTTSNSEDIRMDTVDKITEIVDELYLSKSVQNEIDCVNSYNNIVFETQKPFYFGSSINQNKASQSIHLTYPSTSISEVITTNTAEPVSGTFGELYVSKCKQSETDCANRFNNIECESQETSHFSSSINQNKAREAIHLTYPSTSISEVITTNTAEPVSGTFGELYVSKCKQSETDCVNSYNNIECESQESSINQNKASKSIHLTYPSTSIREIITTNTVEPVSGTYRELYVSNCKQSETDCANSYNNIECETQGTPHFSSSISQNNATESIYLTYPITNNSEVITMDTVEPVTETIDELYVSKPVQSETDCANNYNNIECETQKTSHFSSSISQNNATESIYLTYSTTNNSEVITMDTVEPVTETIDELYVSKPVQSETDCANNYNNIECETQKTSHFSTSISQNNATDSIYLTYPTTINSEFITTDNTESVTEAVNELYVTKSVQSETDCANNYNNIECETQKTSRFSSSIIQNNATDSIYLTYPTTINSEFITTDTTESVTEAVSELYETKPEQSETDCVDSYNNIECKTQETSHFSSSISQNNATESIHLTYPSKSISEVITTDTEEPVTEAVYKLYVPMPLQNATDCATNTYNNIACKTQKTSHFGSSISQDINTVYKHLTYQATSSSEVVTTDTEEPGTGTLYELYVSMPVQSETDCANNYNNIECQTQETSQFGSSISQNNATESIYLTYPTTSNSDFIITNTKKPGTETFGKLYMSMPVQSKTDCTNSYNNINREPQVTSHLGYPNSQNNAMKPKHLTYTTPSISVVITTDTVQPITETVNELYVLMPVQSKTDCASSFNNIVCEPQKTSHYGYLISQNKDTAYKPLIHGTKNSSEVITINTLEQITETVDELYESKPVQSKTDCTNSYNNIEYETQAISQFSLSSQNKDTRSKHSTWLTARGSEVITIDSEEQMTETVDELYVSKHVQSETDCANNYSNMEYETQAISQFSLGSQNKDTRSKHSTWSTARGSKVITIDTEEQIAETVDDVYVSKPVQSETDCANCYNNIECETQAISQISLKSQNKDTGSKHSTWPTARGSEVITMDTEEQIADTVDELCVSKPVQRKTDSTNNYNNIECETQAISQFNLKSQNKDTGSKHSTWPTARGSEVIIIDTEEQITETVDEQLCVSKSVQSKTDCTNSYNNMEYETQDISQFSLSSQSKDIRSKHSTWPTARGSEVITIDLEEEITETVDELYVSKPVQSETDCANSYNNIECETQAISQFSLKSQNKDTGSKHSTWPTARGSEVITMDTEEQIAETVDEQLCVSKSVQSKTDCTNSYNNMEYETQAISQFSLSSQSKDTRSKHSTWPTARSSEVITIDLEEEITETVDELYVSKPVQSETDCANSYNNIECETQAISQFSLKSQNKDTGSKHSTWPTARGSEVITMDTEEQIAETVDELCVSKPVQSKTDSTNNYINIECETQAITQFSLKSQNKDTSSKHSTWPTARGSEVITIDSEEQMTETVDELYVSKPVQSETDCANNYSTMEYETQAISQFSFGSQNKNTRSKHSTWSTARGSKVITIDTEEQIAETVDDVYVSKPVQSETDCANSYNNIECETQAISQFSLKSQNKDTGSKHSTWPTARGSEVIIIDTEEQITETVDELCVSKSVQSKTDCTNSYDNMEYETQAISQFSLSSQSKDTRSKHSTWPTARGSEVITIDLEEEITETVDELCLSKPVQSKTDSTNNYNKMECETQAISQFSLKSQNKDTGSKHSTWPTARGSEVITIDTEEQITETVDELYVSKPVESETNCTNSYNNIECKTQAISQFSLKSQNKDTGSKHSTWPTSRSSEVITIDTEEQIAETVDELYVSKPVESETNCTNSYNNIECKTQAISQFSLKSQNKDTRSKHSTWLTARGSEIITINSEEQITETVDELYVSKPVQSETDCANSYSNMEYETQAISQFSLGSQNKNTRSKHSTWPTARGSEVITIDTEEQIAETVDELYVSKPVESETNCINSYNNMEYETQDISQFRLKSQNKNTDSKHSTLPTARGSEVITIDLEEEITETVDELCLSKPVQSKTDSTNSYNNIECETQAISQFSLKSQNKNTDSKHSTLPTARGSEVITIDLEEEITETVDELCLSKPVQSKTDSTNNFNKMECETQAISQFSLKSQNKDIESKHSTRPTARGSEVTTMDTVRHITETVNELYVSKPVQSKTDSTNRYNNIECKTHVNSYSGLNSQNKVTKIKHLKYLTTINSKAITIDTVQQMNGKVYKKFIPLRNFARDSDACSIFSSESLEKTFTCSMCDYECNQSKLLINHVRAHIGEKPFTCNLCGYKCTIKTNLVRHMKTHTDEKPFSCKFCDYKTKESDKLADHIRTHTGMKPYKCKECSYSCYIKCNLKRHMRTHTGEKPYACSLCDFKCNASSSLNVHMRIHTGEKPFACSLCDFKCTVSSNLNAHMLSHNEIGDNSFECTLCDYKCNVKIQLDNHKLTHAGENTFACNKCDFKCNNKSTLTSHLRTHISENIFSCSQCDFKCDMSSTWISHIKSHSSEITLKCSICDYKSTSNSSLANHMKTHNIEKLFSCNLCDFNCRMSNSLKRHMRTHTGEKPHSCTLCEYKCVQKANLVRHMKTHTEERQFACNLCDYKTKSKSTLVTHEKIHTGDNIFTCTKCDYKCNVKASLTAHMQTHSAGKSFVCGVCDYACKNGKNLARHMRTHAGEKLVACSLCDYKCKTNSRLTSHMRTHNGEKPFACNICDYKCSTNGYLVQHKRIHTSK